ncbi:MAG: pitrilysin family protein [Kofleriaceae bacterium]
MTSLVLASCAALAACGGKPTPPPTLPTDLASAPATPPVPPVAAAPADPAPKTEGTITDAWVHGLHILIKRNPGSETTVTNLYIRGGVRNWTAADAGIERLALATAVHGGTTSLAKDAFTTKLSELGSSIGFDSNDDYAGIMSWSLTPAWDATFALLADAFLHPALPAAQIEIDRQRQLAAITGEEDNPDSLLTRRLAETIYKGHPYANRAIGTKAAVAALTSAQLRAHLDGLRETSRLLLVVVGDVDPQHVLDTASAAFGGVPRGDYHEAALAPVTSAKGALTVFEKKLPTNYIEASTTGPSWGSPDFFVAWLGMSVLQQRVFMEVRTKRNLSYAPSAWLTTASALPRADLYVTAVDPVTTMKVMFDEARRLRDEPIPADELAGHQASFLTRTLMRAEDAAGQANQLASAQLRGGDWHLLQDLPAKIEAITPAQIQAWAKTHLTRFQTVVIGDPTKLDRAALESF